MICAKMKAVLWLVLVAAPVTLCIAGKISSSEDTDCLDTVEETSVKPVKRCSGKGEVWLKCGDYQPCDPVCGQEHQKCDRVYKKCPEGCQCPEGYAQIPGSRDCVRKEKCPKEPKSCPKNMVWSDCATTCTDNCNKSSMRCSAVCRQRCVCKKNYSMNENGICIRTDKCPTFPPSCPVNMVWSECANDCTDHCDRASMTCNEKCDQKCICKKNYSMNRNGVCVPTKECPKDPPENPPKTCPKNMKWCECANACTDHCNKTIMLCQSGCKERCICEDGFSMNDNGVCVPSGKCKSSQKTCPANMEWKDCATPCDDHCNKHLMDCAERCDQRCVCKKNYSMSDCGECIRTSKCFE